MATANITGDHCNFVVAGQPSPDVAMVVNGIAGCELLTQDDSNKQGIVFKKQSLNGVAVTACAFLGLGVSSDQTPVSIRAQCPKDQVGVILYCITVNGLAFEREGIKEGMEKITNAYGADIWQRCVIVFLRAH